MAKKRKQNAKSTSASSSAHIENGGILQAQPITDTLRKNYMPYAMSVIISRAIPEIDGFKPSHRKLLYTMYKMGLLSGSRTKSANVVGQTMRLNPHGDQTIYETMVRLTRGCEALLHPYVDSKGNFGKAYSRDMAYAASRYTEVKLDKLCQAVFGDIDQNTVDFVDNYDNTMQEPTLLPVSFPSILVNANVGIAVGMASSICPFNLRDVCEATIALIRNPEADVFSILKAPDFPGGGFIVYRSEPLQQIFETGRGSIRVRAKYAYDSASHCIDVTEIPPTTSVEAIMDKIVEQVKAGKLREISDVRDETDLSGLKLTLDLKRGVDPTKLMQKLFRLTPLEDSFSCNFNVLLNGMPKVCGIRELLLSWINFRRVCVTRRITFQLEKKRSKLHLLEGLQKILLDVDKAIAVIRETEEDDEVVQNLMIAFGIDEPQAEYVAEIKLRQLNRSHILHRLEELKALAEDIRTLEGVLADPQKLLGVIALELRDIANKFGQPRKSLLYFPEADEDVLLEEEPTDYPVTFFLTREGYFKKITPQSLRMNSEQKCKDSDAIAQTIEGSSSMDLLFFTDQGNVYKAKATDFEDAKASVLGEYIPARLSFTEGESVIYMTALSAYTGFMVFIFTNGKVAKVDLSSYATKTNRKRLTGAFYTQTPLAGLFYLPQDAELLLESSSGRLLLIHTGSVAPKTTRTTQGIACMTLRGSHYVAKVALYTEGMLPNPHRFRTKSLPAAGSLPKEDDIGQQLSL